MPEGDPIPEGVPEILISIGSRGSLTSDDRAALAGFDWINRSGWWKWDRISEPLPETKLKNLFRGLVITEKELEWTGGSVAGAIWVFRTYERRFKNRSETLTDWALRNRGPNSYVPFGSMTFARNMDESGFFYLHPTMFARRGNDPTEL